MAPDNVPTSTGGVAAEDQTSPPLFYEVTFHIVVSSKLTAEHAREIAEILVKNGATKSTFENAQRSRISIDLEEVTHIISADIDFPGYADAENLMIPVVTPEWVKTSVQKQRLAHVRPFTPDPRFFFSGVMATVVELPTGDKEAICGGIIAMGGQYSNALTKFTTHVVALNMDNEKCKQAVAKKLKVKIVLPHWFDDCLKLNRRIDESPYLLPDPEIERLDSTKPVPLPRGPDLSYSHAHNGGPMSQGPPVPRPDFTVFDRKRVKLSEDLNLSQRLRDVISTIITQAKGEITDKIEDAHVYVCQYREGKDYLQACKRAIIVGNLTWLYWMFAHGEWASPLRRLLHYPIVRGGLPGMRNNIITVSNYGGDARLYLENLIEAFGAKFTKSMKADNTHLITARSQSEKCTAALEWNINMVNHLWLEESYAKWEVQSLTNPRYTHFPTRTNLMEIVGQTAIDPKTLEKFYSTPDAGDYGSNGLVSSSAMQPSTSRESPLPRGKATKQSRQSLSTPKLSRRNTGEMSELSFSTSSSGRKAKEQAAMRLHDQIMPDVMLYEKEQKRKGGVLGMGRRMSASPAAEERWKGARKRTASMEPGSADEEGGKAPKKGKKRPKPTVHLLITGYKGWIDQPQKEDADKRGLAEIGINCVAEPTQCTHLAAPHLVRTEKFCCALATAPVVVSTDWPEACLRERKILDAEPYLLEDTEGEKRLNVTLRDSLALAKKNAGKLLAGQTIYCTPGVRGGFETYKKIVEANGGVCISFRMAKRASNAPDSEKMVLLSSEDPGDKKLWLAFHKMAKSYDKEAVIYGHEWLLDAAMTQKIVWGDKYEFTKK
ncbi:regulator of Ty1 Transposition [Rhizina undulata]